MQTGRLDERLFALSSSVSKSTKRKSKSCTGWTKALLLRPPQGAIRNIVAGVISPILANIYMRRFLLAWEQWGLSQKLHAHVVNYADDFVILCRGTATEARTEAEGILHRLKLTVNEEKTRVVNAWREPFDFLGYTFGRCFKAGSSRIYLGAKPAKKRVQRIYQAIRDFLHRGNDLSVEDVVYRVNSRLEGWAFYYSYGTVSRAYKKLDRLVADRLRAWLCDRHKVSGRGTRRFSDQVLYDEYGLVRLTVNLTAQRSNA